MTVSAQTPINRSTGNGVTTVFPYSFKIVSSADIEVSVADVVKTLNVDYTVSGVGDDAGGNVTMTAAPANGASVVRRRNMALVRSTDYQDQGELPASTLDADIDATVLMIQQVDENTSRAMLLPVAVSGFSTELPTPVANSFLRINSTATALELATEMTPGALTVTPYIETLLNDSDATAARATLGAATSGPLASSGITGAAASGAITASGLTQATSRLLGRTTASTGAVEELTVGSGLSLASGSLSVSGRVIAQVQTFSTGAVATGTTTIPGDDTIPQITEGDQYMTLAFTPTNVNSTLEIDVLWVGSHDTGTQIVVALFRDAVTDAISVSCKNTHTGTAIADIAFKHVMTAGTTSVITFRVRAGATAAGTMTFNGAAGVRRFGGLVASRITIKEYLP